MYSGRNICSGGDVAGSLTTAFVKTWLFSPVQCVNKWLSVQLSLQISLTLPVDFTANGSKMCFDDFCSLLHNVSVH